MASTTLIAKLIGDAKSMVNAFNEGEKSAAALGKVGKAAGVGLAAMGAASTAAFAVSINKAMDFESAISSIGAVSQATDKEMQGLNDTALRLGRETKFGAMDAAAAMETLAANGISAKDIMGGAADAAAQLAAAGGTDIVSAADTASTAMTVWNLKTKDLTDVVNRLAGAANVSRFGVEDMSMAIAQGGGAAASGGVEFKDFATAIAAIAPSFASGSDAGTSFKTFVARLAADTKPARKAMAELGLSTKESANHFFDAQGNLKSMAEITDLLHNSTKNLDELQKARLLGDIFGTDAIRTAAALSGKTGKEFAAMSDQMRDTSALELAKKRMDNAAGSMEQLKGAIEVVQISVGQKFLPVVKAVADFAANVLPKIPTPVIVAVGALTVLIGVLASLALVIGPIITIAPLLGIAFTAMLGPVGLVIAAIAAVIAIGVLLYKNWDTIKAKAHEFGLGGLVTAVEAVAGAFKLAWEWAGKFIEMIGKIPGGTEAAKAGVGGAVKGLIGGIPVIGPAINAALGAGSIANMIAGKRANGGPVSAGSSYLVGERGAEVFTPNTSGRITANGGGNTFVFNIETMIGDDAAAQQIIRRALTALDLRGVGGR